LTWSATYASTALSAGNGDGARLKQTVNGAETAYTLDPSASSGQALAAPLVTVLEEQEAGGKTTYLYGMGDSPLASYDDTLSGDFGELSRAVEGWTYLSGRDGLNSVRQETDASGNIIAARSFDPYSVLLQGGGGSPFGYTGEMADVTGLVFLRARYMQPELGMFLSHDPWSGDELRPCSMNGWSYVEGAPINLTDPTGRTPRPPFGSEPGQYEYSCNCGWIDWNHADPGNPLTIIRDIKRDINDPGALFRGGTFVSISENDPRGGGGVAGYINVNSSKLRQFPSALYGVSLGVYIEVNNLFENYQGGNAPGVVGPLRWAVMAFKQGPLENSSFSQEDLMSDLIGFYIAVEMDRNGDAARRDAKENIREACGVVGRELGTGDPIYQQKQAAIYEKSLIRGGHYFEQVDEWFHPWLYCGLDDCGSLPRLPNLFLEITPIPHSNGGFWNWNRAYAWIKLPHLSTQYGQYDTTELNR
jgi:RHS repeat-associated protein